MVHIFWVTLEAHLGGRPRWAAGSTLFFGQNKPEGATKVIFEPGSLLTEQDLNERVPHLLGVNVRSGRCLALSLRTRRISGFRFSSGGATTEMGPTVIDINCCGVRRKVTHIFNLVSVIPPVTSHDAISLFKSFSYSWISTLW